MNTELDYDDDPPPRWWQGMRPAAWAVLSLVIVFPLAGLIAVGTIAAHRAGEKRESKVSRLDKRPAKSNIPQATSVEKAAQQKTENATSTLPSNSSARPPKSKSQPVPKREPRHTDQEDKAPTSPTFPLRQAEQNQDKPIPVPGTLLDEVVTGYETRRLLGFTFLLSTQAIKEGQKEQGKPFQALETEFDGLAHVLPANALKHLRGILIWVEWDNIDRRNPDVLAKYYGGRIWKLDGSSHPLKSNAVEVLSIKKLAEEKAATREKRRLVLLHELAHAVHHLALGFDNIDVKYAYNQAMDRRLYDKVQDAFGEEVRAYAATNDAEYFAELTCAYLDRCLYFPFTRADLREHDPTGYKLMQKYWGPDKAPSKQKGQSK